MPKMLERIGRHLPETPVLCLLLVAIMVPCIMLSGNFIATAKDSEVSYPIYEELQADDIPLADRPKLADDLPTAFEVFVSTEEPAIREAAEEYDVPAEAIAFKAWMPYTAITDKTSDQWALQQDAWTDEDGFRRYGDEGYYMVAMGTYYSEKCGKVFDITFESGKTIRCIIGDIKADIHTDELHKHRYGNVVEFIVDKEVISRTCKRMGDMSYASGVNLTGKPTKIVACG